MYLQICTYPRCDLCPPLSCSTFHLSRFLAALLVIVFSCHRATPQVSNENNQVDVERRASSSIFYPFFPHSPSSRISGATVRAVCTLVGCTFARQYYFIPMRMRIGCSSLSRHSYESLRHLVFNVYRPL